MLVKLNDVVSKISGNVDRFTTDLEYYLGGEHYESDRIAIYSKGIIKDNLGVLGFKFHFPFVAGDTIFMSRNPHLKKAGMITYDGICSDTSYILRTKDNNVLDERYLPLVLQNEKFWRWFEENKSGSVNYLLNWKTLREYEFELPSIEEQCRIADMAWSIEKTIVSYEKMIEAIDELVKSQFIKMFDQETNTERLDNLCTLFGDGDWIETKDQAEEGIRLIQTGNIGDGEFKDKGDKARFISEETFERLNCTEVIPGDILVSRLPDPIGRACIIPEMSKAITAVDCTIIRLKDILLPTFFVHYTKTPMYMNQVDSYTTGSTRKRISRANLGSIKVPVPSIDLQNEFVAFADQAEKTKSSLQQSLSDAKSLQKIVIESNFATPKEEG